jgi:hypothetical protein
MVLAPLDAGGFASHKRHGKFDERGNRPLLTSLGSFA